jgi:hypothetical protein
VDVTNFYALFSATCFTLVGLWWNVVSGRPAWLADTELRRAVGGIYATFLIPAMMGLFAQVGGTENPHVWRASFVVLALVGAASTLTLLSRQRSEVPLRVLAGLVYVVIAVVGVRPEVADGLDLRPIQAEALLLILLVGLGHALAWRFMTSPGAVAEVEE